MYLLKTFTAITTVTFTQPEEVYAQFIINTEHFIKMPLLLQCKASINSGWDLIMDMLIWTLRICLALIIPGFAIFIVKKNRRQWNILHK